MVLHSTVGPGFTGRRIGFTGHGIGFTESGIGFTGRRIGFPGHGTGFTGRGIGFAGRGIEFIRRGVDLPNVVKDFQEWQNVVLDLPEVHGTRISTKNTYGIYNKVTASIN